MSDSDGRENGKLENKTLAEKPEGKNIVKCRWVLTAKKEKAGNVKKYNARVVAKGFHGQKEYIIMKYSLQRFAILQFEHFWPYQRN